MGDIDALKIWSLAQKHDHTDPEFVAALDAAEARAGVKPLVWVQCEGNFNGQNVWCFDALKWMWIVQNNGGQYIWCEDVTPTWAPASPVRGSFDTLAAAQAAAQADYTARILSTITISASPLSAVATLVAAVERLNAACDAMWNDHARLEKNAGYFAGQQPWQLKEVHMRAISEAQQCLPEALALFARKAGV